MSLQHRFDTIRSVRRAEQLLTTILGILLVLLCLVLLASPRVAYTTHEKILRGRFSVEREKTMIVPRPAAILIICAVAAVMILWSRKPKE